MKNTRKIACAVAIVMSSNLAVSQNLTDQQSPPPNGKFLVPVLIAAISNGVGPGVTSFIGSLFNKLTNLAFGEPCVQQGFNQMQNGYPQQNGYQANCGNSQQQPNSYQQQQPYVNQQQQQYVNQQQQQYGNQQQQQYGNQQQQPYVNQQQQPYGNQPQQPNINQQQQTLNSPSNIQLNNIVNAPAQSNVVPALLYKIEQLDPTSFQTIRVFDDVKNNPPSFMAGEVFTITYEPNMPGQLRLENIDPQNVTSAIGTYNAVGRKPRRLPATKGFLVSGPAGTEQINIYFTPCRPAEALNQPGVVEFQQLPICSNTQATNLAKAGKSGGIQPKAITNMESPDPTIAVEVSNDYTQTDLQNGVPVKSEIKVINKGVVGI